MGRATTSSAPPQSAGPGRPMSRAAALGALLLGLGAAGCRATREVTSIYPPPDFKVSIQYAVVDGERTQVRRRASIYANGLVVLREADRSLRTGDPAIALPVFRRLCVYRLDWRSIRSLSRELARDRAKDAEQPVHRPAEGEVHEIDFDLTYSGNRVELVLTNRAVGLMNRVLRKIDAFLPDGHGFTLPGSMGVPEERRVQDVPPVMDSVQGSLGYHQAWLREVPDDRGLLQDTFALACVARDWDVAERCLAQLRPLVEPPVRDGLRDILQAAKAGAAPR